MRKLILLFWAVFSLSSCVSIVGKKCSPTEIGYGFQFDPGYQIGNSNNSVHGLLSYSRLSFDGGHDNMYQFGGQFRHYHNSFSDGGLWYGGEASYVRFTSVYNNDEWYNEKPRAGGFAMGGLVGYRLPVKAVPISGYAGVGFVTFGDFKSDDMVVDAGATGVTFRIGVSLHLLSLWVDKGR